MTICHRTGSARRPYVRIRVSRSALPAHLRHGDVIPGSRACPSRVVRTDGKGHVLGVRATKKGKPRPRVGVGYAG